MHARTRGEELSRRGEFATRYFSRVIYFIKKLPDKFKSAVKKKKKKNEGEVGEIRGEINR